MTDLRRAHSAGLMESRSYGSTEPSFAGLTEIRNYESMENERAKDKII